MPTLRAPLVVSAEIRGRSCHIYVLARSVVRLGERRKSGRRGVGPWEFKSGRPESLAFAVRIRLFSRDAREIPSEDGVRSCSSEDLRAAPWEP